MQRELRSTMADKKKQEQEARWDKKIASGVAKMRRKEEKYLEEEARLRKKEEKKEAEQEMKKKDANKKKTDDGMMKEAKGTGTMKKNKEAKKSKKCDQKKSKDLEEVGKKPDAADAKEKKEKTKKLTAEERAARTARNKKIGPAPKHKYAGVPDDMRAQVRLMHKANNMMDIRMGRSHHGLDLTASYEEPILDECPTQTESISPLGNPSDEDATNGNLAPK